MKWSNVVLAIMAVLSAMFGVFSVADAANPIPRNGYPTPATSNTISPGEEKFWGPIKEDQLLRIYCKSEGKPLEMSFVPAYWGNNIWRKSGQIPPPAPMLGPCQYCGGRGSPESGECMCENKGVGVVFGLNIYGARAFKGPWQWLGSQMWGYDQLSYLNPQKEIGNIPEFYRFDIFCYQNDCRCVSSQGGIGDKDKMVRLLVVGFNTEGSAPVQTDNYNVGLTQSCSNLAAKFVEAINGVKVKENLFYLKALLDSAKLFLADAKKEPGLSKTAGTALQQVSAIEQYLNVNQGKLRNLKTKQREAEVKPLYDKLAQVIQTFADGAKEGKDKLPLAKTEAVSAPQNNQSK